MINVNNFRPGITFKVANDIFIVLESQHSQQARGQANVKVKIKNLRTGATTTTTYTGGDKVEPAVIDKREMDLLYNDGSNLVLMDLESFEQTSLPLKSVTWALNFLREGARITVRFFETEVLDIELPTNVKLRVTEAPEGARGNSVSVPSKKIKVETGLELDAPMFIKEGEEIIVATETGKYVGRA